MQHIRSYYAASANPAPLREPLRGAITADVCVMGGGIAGCSTALHLAERGYKVVLLEGKRIGWGASGRSGGQAIFGFAAGQDKLVAQVGRDTAKRMFDVSVEALDLLKERVARHVIDCVFSVIYSLRIIQRVFHGPLEEKRPLADLSLRETTVMIVLMIPLIWLGLFPQAVLSAAPPALKGIMSHTISEGFTPVSHRPEGTL